MKKLLLIALVAGCMQGYAQKKEKLTLPDIPRVNNQYEYSEIVNVDSSLTKDILYKNAKLYFANAFKSAQNVIQYDDQASGKVMGKGNIECAANKTVLLTPILLEWRVNFSLEISCKDGKYRYRYYNFNILQGNSRYADTPIDQQWIDKTSKKGMFKDQYIKMVNQLNDQILVSISGLKEYMSGNKNSLASDNF